MRMSGLGEFVMSNSARTNTYRYLRGQHFNQVWQFGLGLIFIFFMAAGRADASSMEVSIDTLRAFCGVIGLYLIVRSVRLSWSELTYDDDSLTIKRPFSTKRVVLSNVARFEFRQRLVFPGKYVAVVLRDGGFVRTMFLTPGGILESIRNENIRQFVDNLNEDLDRRIA